MVRLPLSQSTSLSSTPPRETAARERTPARRPLRPIRLTIFLLVVAVAALFEPNYFRFVARQLIALEAWRTGISVQIGGIDGSLLEPLVLRNSVWIYESGSGPITRLEIADATAVFSWRNLLPRSSGPWFERLTINGLTGKIQFPTEVAPLVESTPLSYFKLPSPRGGSFPAPELIEAKGVDFIFQSNTDYLRLADTDFTLSKVAPGKLRAGQIAIKQPWLNRTFRDVRATTALQDTRVELANLTLEPGVQIQSFSAEMDKLARGQLNLDMRLAAFGGEIRIAAKTLSQQRPFAFEATGNFSQIGVAKLSTFLGASDAAGGTIKGGYFTFRGPPQQLERATARLRLEATNFQWESRQWDALVFGASLMEGRVQVPEFALTQGHNRLNLNGEMPLPTPGVAWWQSEFSVNIAAKIENLTELSALMLPEFQFAAGRANIDGSIRGKDQQFNGQLIVSGSNLKWHNAPIEELHAGVKLTGNELQLTNISLFNNGDYLRGHGVVNIIGDKQYWGEVHASIEDLAQYSALLQKPIVPEPLAGGANIDWSGEGSAKGHSGKFSARLRKLRSLGTTAALLHPINADLDGNYAPGMMQFSRFLLSDDVSSFTANVGVGNKALSFQDIKLYHQQALWLEGDALLPFDVWNAWPNTTLAKLFDDQTVCKLNLTAHNLDLREASLLTGWKFPIEGVVTGNVVAEGPVNGLKTGGKLTLTKAQIPLGWSGELLTNVQGEATLEGANVIVKTISAQHSTGKYTGTGQVTLTDVRNPTLQMTILGAGTRLPLFATSESSLIAEVGGKVDVTGPVNAATVKGDLQLLSARYTAAPNASKLTPMVDFTPLFLGDTGGDLPAVLATPVAPWSDWKFETTLRTPTPAPLTVDTAWRGNPATLATDLRLIGSGGALDLTGTATIRGGNFDVQESTLTLTEATLHFREGFTTNPSLIVQAHGEAFGEKFTHHVVGTLEQPMHFFVFAPPLTEQTILASFRTTPPALDRPAPVALRVAAELFEGVEVAEWTPIVIPPPAPAVPPPAPAPAPATPVPAPVPGVAQ